MTDRIDAIVASVETLELYLKDTTAKSFTRQHGTQYSYFQEDGGYNLVYPGNASVLKGNWEVREGGLFGPEICYSYTTSTYNPATEESNLPGEWDCQTASNSLRRWKEIRDGDPLTLATTTLLPRRLPKGINLSIPTAAKSVGLSTEMALNKSPNPDLAADEKIGK